MHNNSEFKTLIYKEKHFGGALVSTSVIDVFPTRFEGYYLSMNGRVYSFKRSKIIEVNQRLRGGNKDGKQYWAFDVYVDGKPTTVYTHREMAIVFIPNFDPMVLTDVNHIDGTNRNHVNNIEWCTPKYNNRHKVDRKKYGRIDPLPLEVEEIEVTCKYKGSVR